TFDGSHARQIRPACPEAFQELGLGAGELSLVKAARVAGFGIDPRRLGKSFERIAGDELHLREEGRDRPHRISERRAYKDAELNIVAGQLSTDQIVSKH